MTTDAYQIRLCLSCGLRYPLEYKKFSRTRCPVCQSVTQLVAEYSRQAESWVPSYDSSFHFEALLDNIPSAGNVGLIFRTARAFGVKHLYLCGITSTPGVDAVRASSLGAEETVTWTYHKDAVLTLRALKEQGYKLFALGHGPGAVSIKEIALARRRRSSDLNKKPAEVKSGSKSGKQRWIGPAEKMVFVIGNEITGVDPDLIHLCDDVVFIPALGNKNTLSAALAFTVAISQMVL